jgi:hypothetical protein
MKLLLTTCILAAVAVGAIVGARPAIALPSWPEPDFGALCRSADIVAMVTVDAHLGVATASTGEQVDSGKAGVRAVDPGEILRGFGVTVHRYTIDRTGKFLGKFVIWQATGQEATQWPDAGWRVGLPPNLAPPALLPYLLVPGDAYVVFARLADLSSADLRAADPAPVHEEASQSGSPGPVLLVDRPEAVTPTFYSWGGSGEETVIQELRSAEVEPGNYAACQIDWAYHTLESYCRGAAPRGDEPMVEAAVRAILTVWRPCLFTTLTTACGFLSLLLSPIRPVSQMGLLAAAGVCLTLLVTTCLVPILLAALRPPPAGFLARQQQGPLRRMLVRLQGGQPRRWWLVVACGGGLLVASASGIGWLRVGTNMLEFFPPGDPVRQATEQVDRLIGGSISVEYLIQADGERGYLTPERLARLDRFGDYLREQPNVTGIHGLTEVLKELDAAVRGVPATQGRLPTSQPQLAQYLLLLEGSDLVRRFVRQQGRLGRFSLRVRAIGSEVLSGRVPEIDRHREQQIETDGFRLPGTGLVPLMNRMELFLLTSQLRSFGLALIVITMMMMALLRSVRLGLLGMIPNLGPVLVTLGWMGWAGIRLDIGTVMIASVVLGLVVDDSIHLLARFQRLVEQGVALDAAVDQALIGVGRPIVVTSLVLVAGFWTLLFASFQPNIYFGLLSGLAILTALIADLMLLPALLHLVRPRIAARPR